jgi:hypothetical protein
VRLAEFHAAAQVEDREFAALREPRRVGPLLPSAKLLLVSSRTAPSPAGPGELWLPTPCSDAELMSAVRQAHIV